VQIDSRLKSSKVRFGEAPLRLRSGRLHQVAAATAPQTRPTTYSLHIRVRTFAMFSDEAVDPRRDNGQRYRAELEHGLSPDPLKC
jgi:hypothetical protein